MTLTEIVKRLAHADRRTLDRVGKAMEGDAGDGRASTDIRTVTQREAARMLNVSVSTIWRLIGEDAIKAVDMRGKKRVLLASLYEFAGAGLKG